MTLKNYQNDQYIYKRPLNSLVISEMQIKAIMLLLKTHKEWLNLKKKREREKMSK